MKRVLVFFLLCIVFHADFFSQDYLNNPDYIAQNGFGATSVEAEQNALAAISRFFQSSVSVETSAHATLTDSSSQRELTNTVSVKSETDLFAVHYTKPVFYKNQKLYEVTAYIDRNEAWKLYEPRLLEVVGAFENLYADAENKTDMLQRILGFFEAKKNAEENELSKKCNFAMLLDSEKAAFYESTRTKFSELETKIRALCSQCSISIFCEEDYENRVNQSTISFFSNLGIIVQNNASTKYKCIVFVTENRQALPAGTFFTPSFKIEIRKNENVVFSSGKQLKKIGAKNQGIAKQRAYSAIASAIESILNEEFSSF